MYKEWDMQMGNPGSVKAGVIMCENMPKNGLKNPQPKVLQFFWPIFHLKNQPPAAPRA